MKKQGMMVIVWWVVQWAMVFYPGTAVLASPPWGISVYPSSEAEDIDQLMIAGVDLEEYGYAHVYQYVLVQEKTLFVLGSKKEDERAFAPLLSAISLNDRKATVVVEYSPNLIWSLDRTSFTVFFLDHLSPSRPFVLIHYAKGNIYREGEERVKSYLELFRVEPERGTAQLLRKEQLTEWDIAYNSEPDSQYKYEGFSEPGPAKKDLTTIFFSDANQDGFADILIWKRRYVSRAIDDRREGEFFLEGEEVDVLYFEPAGLTFSAVTPLDARRVKDSGDIFFPNK
jgi:hypothetical protein